MKHVLRKLEALEISDMGKIEEHWLYDFMNGMYQLEFPLRCFVIEYMMHHVRV